MMPLIWFKHAPTTSAFAAGANFLSPRNADGNRTRLVRASPRIRRLHDPPIHQPELMYQATGVPSRVLGVDARLRGLLHVLGRLDLIILARRVFVFTFFVAFWGCFFVASFLNRFFSRNASSSKAAGRC